MDSLEGERRTPGRDPPWRVGGSSSSQAWQLSRPRTTELESLPRNLSRPKRDRREGTNHRVVVAAVVVVVGGGGGVEGVCPRAMGHSG